MNDTLDLLAEHMGVGQEVAALTSKVYGTPRALGVQACTCFHASAAQLFRQKAAADDGGCTIRHSRALTAHIIN